ncbi:pseudouridine synthase [Pseudoramibacter alactolyticus]|uniref:pseudouridine synthase n=1 Tax=Pseudoramibacter alactolyticus TaxID=113287 RepID=UPI00248EF349|nr:pseudouridine synthase [Pseudoramibacter alactolyticus]
MRLQKYMAQCGVASRRGSEAMIADGRVMVNGSVVDTPGVQVTPGDVVFVDGKLIAPERKVYLLLNKPRGVVTTSEDVHAERRILDLVAAEVRLYAVGRLDKDTEGLLILTNDGDFTFRLTHPSYHLDKVYEAVVKGQLTAPALAALREGVVIPLDDAGTKTYRTQPAEVTVLQRKRGSTRLAITLREGKKRQIRKMCAAVGYPVVALRRTAIGDIADDTLKPGEWRRLRPDEVAKLRRAVQGEGDA